MQTIDFIKIPRLEWDDRHIQYDITTFNEDQQSDPNISTALKLPKKIIVAGKYKSTIDAKGKVSTSNRLMPFVGLIDTT